MFTSVKTKVMNASIGTRLVIIIYACIVAIFISLSVVLLILGERTSQEELLSSSTDSVKYANLLIEKEQQYLMGIAEYYSLSPSVQELFHANAEGLQYPETDSIMQVVRARMYCVGLAFYDLQGQPIEYMSIDNSWGPISQNGIDRPLQRMLSGYHTYEWEFIDQNASVYMERDNSPKITLWYLIKDAHTFRPLGAVSISLDSRKIFTSNSVPDKPYNQYTVLSQSGQIVFSEHEPALSKEACSVLLANTASDGSVSGNFIATLDGIKYRVVYADVKQSHFCTYMLIPYRPFTWNLSPFYGYAVGCVLLSILLILPILLFTSWTLVRPLRKLAASMDQFKEGNFDVEVHFRYNDEIGQLGRSFNEMVQENRRLIENTYLLKIEQQEAELSTLQAQINPHFLYNLINSIQWSALSKGETELADIAYSMGQVFRLSLNRGNNFISIRQERDLISYYLKLQKWRYRDRICYTLNFSEDILEMCIPKLIIQPLVENSVVHGTKRSSDTIHLSVRAYSDPPRTRIFIEVTDDGVGIPTETLHLLPNRLPATHSSPGSHFAMKNIYDRLKLTYHNDFIFQIDSKPEVGTVIHISIPSSPTSADCRKDEHK